MWLQAEGCRLIVHSAHGPLYVQEIHSLSEGEIIRWVRPRIVLEDGEVIPEQRLRLVVWPVDENPVS